MIYKLGALACLSALSLFTSTDARDSDLADFVEH
jgi:hypothetical protein